MTNEAELFSSLNALIIAHREGDKVLEQRARTRFVKALAELKEKNAHAAARVRQHYEKWVAEETKKQASAIRRKKEMPKNPKRRL